MPLNEHSQHEDISSEVNVNYGNNTDMGVLNHGDVVSMPELSEEEIRHILQVSASTGTFWIEWDKLKGILSVMMHKVIADYPEVKLSSEQQYPSLGETYSDLFKRLDDALHTFTQGPPFTLQRFCEILLSAREIYPNLSKLAFALEKNLLVVSTLSVSTEIQALKGLSVDVYKHDPMDMAE